VHDAIIALPAFAICI